MSREVELTTEEEHELRRDGLAYLLSILAVTGPRVGILGFKVCQVCGEIDYYQGFWGAWAMHRIRKDRDGNDVRGEGSFQSHGHAENPEDDDVRYCEVCREAVPLGEVEWFCVKSPLCGKCREAFGRHAVPERWNEMLRTFIGERKDYHSIIEVRSGRRWGTDRYRALLKKTRSKKSQRKAPED